MGDDWVVNNTEVLSGIHCNISNFVIPENVYATVAAWDGIEFGRLEIYAQVSDV